MKQCVFLASVTAVLSLMTAGTAQAGVPQWPQKQRPAPQTKAAMRKAPKPPKQDQVHRAGVDGSITLIQFLSTRRQHDEKHKDQAVPHGSVAQVRASSEDAEPRSPATLRARAVESLPAHWGATHLCI
jgi:hypothetical protein